ncbi:hypothetical protein ACFPIJ_58925 [Dactylosporangium cerinum]|uniref:Uncharacterized protein n=1 Tax=Dactylosporangium cerinum TaxID=1434730 RepID=A0ABV9WJ41_9ACTN
MRVLFNFGTGSPKFAGTDDGALRFAARTDNFTGALSGGTGWTGSFTVPSIRPRLCSRMRL